MSAQMMKLKSLIPLFLSFAIVFAAGICFDRWAAPAMGKGHSAAHGGALNVIGNEIGHVEIRVADDLVELWFVGGGGDTHRAVPIKADKITLRLEKELTLDAAPLALAGESVGNCSHYTARVDWPAAMEEFSGRGIVFFKGRERELLILYPGGYDPLHEETHGRESKGR